jgi:hypothetical protein
MAGGGRGHKSGYVINMAYYSRNIKPGIANLENKGAFNGFREPLLLESGIEQNAPVSPDKPAKLTKKKSSKRSEEEKAAHAEIWEAFEKHLGCKLTGRDAALEAKSIWELIDRVNNGNGWRKELMETVRRFLEYTKTPPKGMDYLKNCQPLPHILNSTRTWLRMMMKPVKEKAVTIDDVNADIGRLRKAGVIR